MTLCRVVAFGNVPASPTSAPSPVSSLLEDSHPTPFLNLGSSLGSSPNTVLPGGRVLFSECCHTGVRKHSLVTRRWPPLPGSEARRCPPRRGGQSASGMGGSRVPHAGGWERGGAGQVLHRVVSSRWPWFYFIFCSFPTSYLVPFSLLYCSLSLCSFIFIFLYYFTRHFVLFFISMS